MREEFADGVWLVQLSGLLDPMLLTNTVADGLGLQDQTLRLQLDVLADHLAERELLLVLDTCEHLVGSCSLLAQVLMTAAPGLHILATSRRSLGAPGERVFTVSPLPVPESGDERLCDSVRLFADRAQAADTTFTLTGRRMDTAVQLCRRLDGIPLAIELAAVWLRTLTAEQIAERLDKRFTLLAGGDGEVGRHETLRTAIGWSHELLEPDERLLWARLSVFPGGFDVGAAMSVCSDDRLPRGGIRGLLEGLVDRSILMRDSCGDGAPRYRLLDTIREYGAEWLSELDELELRHRLHRDHYLELAREYEAAWCGPDQVSWCDRLKCEHANLRAALDFCAADPREQKVGLELVGTLFLFWVPGGFIREGRHYYDRFLSVSQEAGPPLTKALWTCARLAITQGDFEAVAMLLDRCEPYAREQGDRTAEANIAYLRGSAAMLQGDQNTAVPLLEEAAELHSHGGDPGTGLIFAYAVQAMIKVMRGETAEAVALAERSKALADGYGEGWGRSFGDYMHALAEMRRGDTVEAARP
jgi:non-specific serine/threonine protein kinase